MEGPCSLDVVVRRFVAVKTGMFDVGSMATYLVCWWVQIGVAPYDCHC